MMHKEMTLAEVAREIHENAKAHGWWDEERETAEIYALIHSEWSEALEEYRAGRPDKWFFCIADDKVGICPNDACPLTPDVPCLKREPKPEGICVELIDGVIRIFDYMEHSAGMAGWTMQLDEMLYEMYGRDESLMKAVCERSLPALINELHNACTDAFKARGAKDEELANLFAAFGQVWQWIKGRGLDPMELLIEKHEYNKTRPYKHGKVC